MGEPGRVELVIDASVEGETYNVGSRGRTACAWEAGLRRTVEWYAAKREWWEPLRNRAPVEETAWR